MIRRGGVAAALSGSGATVGDRARVAATGQGDPGDWRPRARAARPDVAPPRTTKVLRTVPRRSRVRATADRGARRGRRPGSHLPRPVGHWFGLHDAMDGGGRAMDGMGLYPALGGGIAAASGAFGVAVGHPARGREALAPRVFVVRGRAGSRRVRFAKPWSLLSLGLPRSRPVVALAGA